MSILDVALGPLQRPQLAQGPVWLRAATSGDFGAWSSLREQSRAHLTAWEQDWTPDEMTPQAFRRRVKCYWREMRRGTAAQFLVFLKQGDALAGGVTLYNIRYGASRSATISYWIGDGFLRRGYGRAAMEAALAHAFDDLALNRVEAACQPLNLASRALLTASGFREEGFASAYLRINGAWRDHVLFAITASDRRKAPPAR